MFQYLVFVGAGVQMIGIAAYIRETIRGNTKPNRVSWLMRSIAPVIATVAALAKGVGWAVLPVFISGFGPFLVFLASFANRNAYWKLVSFDYLCGLCSILALVLWGITREPVVAIVFAIASDAFAAVPTLIKSWKRPESETLAPYTTRLFNALTSFAAIKMWSFAAYAFPIYLVVITSSLIFCVKRKKLEYIFSPPRDNVEKYTYQVTALSAAFTLAAIIVATVLALWAIDIARSQLLAQLQELNSKAKIELHGRFYGDVSVGPEVTASTTFYVVPRNKGGFNSANWVAALFFCKDVIIQDYDKAWRMVDEKMFARHSMTPVLKEQAFFSDLVDSLGDFEITLPGKNYYSWDYDQIPIAFYSTYGERTTQVNELILFDSSSKKFVNAPFEANDEKILTDIKGCWRM